MQNRKQPALTDKPQITSLIRQMVNQSCKILLANVETTYEIFNLGNPKLFIMYENVFTEKDVIPSETLIKETLQSNYVQLMEIRQYLEHTIGETREEWKYYGKKIGWNLKKYYKKRNLLFIIIYDGCFKVALVFGDKAVNAINDSNISPELKTALAEARKYAEGRGLSIVVEDARYLGDIKELLQIKLNN